MPPTVLEGVEGLKAAAGRHLGHSDWHEITQEQVNGFADVTGDHQWIHVDVARAAAGPFGGPIAHGYLTLSLLPMLTGEILEVRDVPLVVNAGLDRLRFRTPVRVGAKVRAGAELLSARDAPRDARPRTPRLRAHRPARDRRGRGRAPPRRHRRRRHAVRQGPTQRRAGRATPARGPRRGQHGVDRRSRLHEIA